jgi:hypothetical protein
VFLIALEPYVDLLRSTYLILFFDVLHLLGLNRLWLWLLLSHLEELSSERFTTFFLEELGSSFGFFLVFVHSKVKLDVEAREHGSSILIAHVDVKLSSDSFG